MPSSEHPTDVLVLLVVVGLLLLLWWGAHGPADGVLEAIGLLMLLLLLLLLLLCTGASTHLSAALLHARLPLGYVCDVVCLLVIGSWSNFANTAWRIIAVSAHVLFFDAR